MKWVTRERPKIDRIACPWLIARFIDQRPEFIYVPSDRVLTVARETGAIPYDVPDVELSHVGELCSFDAFLRKYELDEPELQELARIVRGADTARLDLAPQAPGLLALSLGLSALFKDDHEMLRHGMVMYDALYAWLKEARDETHGWPPQTQPQAERTQTRRSTRRRRRASRRAIRRRTRRSPAPAGQSAAEARRGATIVRTRPPLRDGPHPLRL